MVLLNVTPLIESRVSPSLMRPSSPAVPVGVIHCTTIDRCPRSFSLAAIAYGNQLCACD